ncbi:hypothetical protein M3650_29785 [Paenibacillus sp. MER TA 81-3]|uniref:hypothetical protein n=1 Tax=Paenibacillus sp. MER TA 81-3 TaxID=2939573 RepID=UPI00203BC9E5|nr:hypothetical protein [Paenibacillus sp. MER TA 81-3]MCM3342701.1 hypothetical protein [Paenibacillus sp. MER TA 81-3]
MRGKTDILSTIIYYYRDEERMRNLWSNKKEFSKILSLVMEVEHDTSSTTMLQSCAEYFINFTSVFLIKQSSDVLHIFSEINDIKKRVSFMKKFFANDLVSDNIIFNFLNDVEVIKKVGSYREWIELPIMIRARKIITTSNDSEISVDEIIPLDLDLDNSLQEYLLSWAFEEKKLTKEGEDYFRKNFGKKYKQICSVMEQNY